MKTLSLWLFFALFADLSHAQTDVLKDSLLLSPGDSVHIQVFDTPELEEHVRVTDSGYVPLILGGQVKVTGLSPQAAAQAIEGALKRGNFMLDPHVTVSIEQYITENVSVLGQVKSPGSFSLATPRSILTVLSSAGGLNDTASRHITIQRYGTNQKVPYFVSNVADEAIDTSVLVYPGDTVIVPKADIVYMLGDLRRPGGYAWTSNDSKLSALQALTLAGGTPPTAVPSHARLIRKRPGGGYEEIKLQLSKMQRGEQADLPLQPDDIIYVPFSYFKNFIVGADTLISSAASAVVYRF